MNFGFSCFRCHIDVGKKVTLVVVAVRNVGNSRGDCRVRVENYSNVVAFTCGFIKISDGLGVGRVVARST